MPLIEAIATLPKRSGPTIGAGRRKQIFRARVHSSASFPREPLLSAWPHSYWYVRQTRILYSVVAFHFHSLPVGSISVACSFRLLADSLKFDRERLQVVWMLARCTFISPLFTNSLSRNSFAGPQLLSLISILTTILEPSFILPAVAIWSR